MKKQLFLIIQRVIFAYLLTGITPALSQQITSTAIEVKSPKLINFKTLADYRISHPLKHNERSVEQGEDREHRTIFKPKHITGNPPVFNIAPNGERTATSTSPSPRTVFNGILSNHSLYPPDINGAVGNNYIVETTNQEFDILTKTGILNSILDIPTFFAAQKGYYYFDPHVEYDAAHKHYLIISDGLLLSNNDGALFIGVSQTDDPTGNWYTYSFDGIGNDSDFLDYPLIGYNENWVVLTGNDFLANGSAQTNVYVLNRAELYNGSASNVKEFSDPNYVSITPTQTYDTTEANDYLVQDANGNQGGVGYVQIGAISGPLNNPSYSAGTTVGVTSPWSDNSSIGATQPGTSQNIESGLDTRIENSIYRNGALWFTHTVYLPATSPTHCAADWWQVNPSTLNVIQFGRVEDPKGIIDYYYPSIGVDNRSDILLGYCTSSPTIYASAEYSYRTSTDAKNSMETGYLFQSGLTSYIHVSDGRNRYGDFTFTTCDPVDSSFWTFQQFAPIPGNIWGTVVANIGAIPCNNRPTAGIITTLADTICSGEGVILNLIGGTSNTTGIHILWQQSSNDTQGWTIAISKAGDTTNTLYTPPLSGKTYFRCIVTCLNSGLSDTTAPIIVRVLGVYSVSNDTVCTPGNYNLIINGTGPYFNWYHSDTSSSAFYTGDTLKFDITKDTTFYVNTALHQHYSVGVKDNNFGTGGYFNYVFSDGLLFNAQSNFTLDSLYVYANTSGDVTVNLINADNGITVNSVTIPVTNSDINKKTVVRTNFNCVQGTNYNITASGTTVNALFRTDAYANYPYSIPGIISINSANNLASGYYYFFYDWHISTLCISPRVPVNVDVGNLVLTAKASPDTLCQGMGDSTLLTVNGANTYKWKSLSTTDSAVYVKTDSTTTYVVTGSNSAGCTGLTHITVYVENCTGINKINPNNSFIEVYPNPTTGQFDVILNNLPNNHYTISLYNVLGQKLSEKQIDVNSLRYITLLDISMLPTGMYFIRVAGDNQEWKQHITKR